MSTLSVAGVEVRDAGGSDLPAVRRVLLAAYQEYATALPPAVFGRYLAEILDVEGRAGDGRVLVAEHGGRVVGSVTYYDHAAAEGLGWPAGWAGLRALGVEPSARGLGSAGPWSRPAAGAPWPPARPCSASTPAGS
jgi:predicted N-acetyltransferase YhbS